MKLSWFCCVWHLAGLRCTPCRGGLSLCSPGVRQGPSCHYRDSATPKTRGQRMVNPFTVVQPLPFDCMLHVGWVVDISNSELNFNGLLFLSLINHVPSQCFHCSYHMIIWIIWIICKNWIIRLCSILVCDTISWWAGGTTCTDIAVVVVHQMFAAYVNQGLKHGFWRQHQQHTVQRD